MYEREKPELPVKWTWTEFAAIETVPPFVRVTGSAQIVVARDEKEKCEAQDFDIFSYSPLESKGDTAVYWANSSVCQCQRTLGL